jgi:hypothetical protein
MYQLFPVDSPRRRELQNALDDYLYPPLHLRTFAAASPLQEYPEASVDINRDLPEKLKHYKVLSGGARVDFQKYGELLVASFPVSDNQWQAKAKDCQLVDSGILTVFAVAVYDPYDWLDVKVLSSAESEPSERPTTSIDLDRAYAMTGGGAETIKNEPQGSYLTASYPFSSSDPRSTTFPSNTWKVAAKDHQYAQSGSIKAYVVGVKWSDTFHTNHPDYPPITSECIGIDSSFEVSPAVSVGPPDDTIMVGGGAYDRWDEQKDQAGNMLLGSYPEDSSIWRASGKDHLTASPATLTVYAIGVKNLTPPPSP